MLKKLYIGILCASVSAISVAQDSPSSTSSSASSGSTSGGELSFKSKSGQEVLPQAGEYAIGISAQGTVDFFGNLIGGNGNNFGAAGRFNSAQTPYPINVFNGIYITAKKFTASNQALRLRIGLNNGKDIRNTTVDLFDPIANPSFPQTTENIQNDRRFNLGITAGKEFRRGTTRVQGFYGGEVMFAASKFSQTFEYGNAISYQNSNPDASGLLAATGGGRFLKRDFAGQFYFGVRPFVGVEYFFAPKISLAGEFGVNLGAGFTSGKEKRTIERWDNATSAVVEVNQKAAATVKTTNINLLSTDNLNGQVSLFFHF